MPRELNWPLVVLVLLSGCARTPPPIVAVQGVVRLDGVPLNKVEVRFLPVDDFGAPYVARGVTDEAGRFILMCQGHPGACAGDNHILVMESEIPSHLLSERAQVELAAYRAQLGPRPPHRYGSLVDSPLKVTVQAGQTDYDLNLTVEP